MTAVPKQALLLAGGIGSRLRPLTDVLPKCLMPICGRPLLGLWLDQLAAANIERIVINTHHHADLVHAYVASTSHAQRVVLSYEPNLLGTAGTLISQTPNFGEGPILLAHADNLTLFNFSSFAEKHACRLPGTIMTMMTFRTDTPETCGIVELDASGRVVAFHEKRANPPGNLANAAVYIVEPEVSIIAATLLAPSSDFSLDVVPELLGRTETFHNDAYHRDIGTGASLAIAQFEYPIALEKAGQLLHDLREPSSIWRDQTRSTKFLIALAAVYSA